MRRQLDALGVAYEFIAAVDGQALTPAQWALYSHEEALRCKKRELSVGEIGCALSHAHIYQRMIDEGLGELLVLEDDVNLAPEFFEIVQMRDKFPAVWDAINLSSSQGDPVPFAVNPCRPDWMCRFEGWANSSQAYLLRLAGAQKLHEHLYPIRLPSDDMQWWPGYAGLIFYGIDPRPVRPAGFHSDIWDYGGQWWELEHRAGTMSPAELLVGRMRARTRRYSQRLLGPARERISFRCATRRPS